MSGGDFLENLVSVLLRTGAIPWWVAVLAVLAYCAFMWGRSRGWFKLLPPEPVDPNMYGGDPNITTGPPSEYGGGTPPEPGDGTGAGGG